MMRISAVGSHVSKAVVLALAIVCSTLTSVPAADMKLETLLEKMQAADKKISSVRFEFRQEIRYALTSETQLNNGEVTFQKPNNLYLKQKNPLEQVIVSNGKKVWVHTPSYNQVVVDSWKRWMKDSIVPASLLQLGRDWNGLKNDYDFTALGADGDMYVLLLSPRQRSPMGEWKLKLWVDTKEFIPRKTVLMGDNVTVSMETSNYTINPDIDKKIFTFTPSRQTEVLNLP